MLMMSDDVFDKLAGIDLWIVESITCYATSIT